jgi:hypothetical protein
VSRCLFLLGVAIAFCSAAPAAVRGPLAAGLQEPEVVDIDGSKTPELIPQWSAWGFAFRVIAGGSRLLPSAVHAAVSKDEAEMVQREADAMLLFAKGCESKVSELRARVGRERPEALDRQLRDITLECRRRTLDARDRVLNALNPRAAAALMQFVESTKSGTAFSIRKKDLPRFLEPE